MHGPLCPANPHKGIFQPALGFTHQYPQGHGQQQAKVPGLFGMAGATHQQAVGFVQPALMPQHQHQVQFQPGFADARRAAEFVHGGVQAGSEQLLGMPERALAQLNAGVGVNRQRLGTGVSRFPGQLGRCAVGIPGFVEFAGRTQGAGTNNLGDQLGLG